MQLVKVLIFSFLFFNISFAQTEFNLLKKAQNNNVDKKEEQVSNEVIDELRNPQETMRTFIKAMDRVKRGDSNSYNEAILTLDLSGIDLASRNSIGKITAERLINTIDRIAKVNFHNIPTNADGPPWFFSKQTVTIDNQLHDVEISLAKTKEGWKFTPETIRTIEDYFHSVEKHKVVDGVIAFTNWKTKFKNKFPEWTGETFVLMKNGQWAGLFIISLLAISMFFISRIMASFYLKKNADNVNKYASTFPIGLFAFALTIKFTVIFLELDIEILEIILRINYILLAFSIVWSSLKIVDYISFHFEKKALISHNKFDDVLVPMLKKTAKVVVICFGGLLVAHSLTFDVASILAGLGIGGVAVALAAKDTISNLFGSVTVILDRPFSIGDYIVLEKNIEGTVEQVGFRSTRIRTPINSLITMPNSVLANLAIDNYGMRSFRRFKTILQLEYGPSEDKILEFIEKLRYHIQLSPAIEKLEVPAQVFINDLGESSINVLLNVYFIAPTAAIELEERHNLILEIMKIAKEVEVSFAYPTRTILMKKD